MADVMMECGACGLTRKLKNGMCAECRDSAKAAELTDALTREREARQKAEEERNAAQAERTAAENALLDIKEAWLTRPKPLSIREAFHRNAPAAVREWDRLADEFVFAADKERNAARSALAAKEAEVARLEADRDHWRSEAKIRTGHAEHWLAAMKKADEFAKTHADARRAAESQLAALREEGARVREALRAMAALFSRGTGDGALLYNWIEWDGHWNGLLEKTLAQADAALASPAIPTPPAGHDASDHEACQPDRCDFKSMVAAGFPAEGGGEPAWIVNDLGELGVMVGGRAYFLYKGRSLEYDSGKHDDGTPMLYRIVGKREFGEVCYPLAATLKGKAPALPYTQELTFTPGLSFGSPEDGAWKPLPVASPAPAPVTQDEVLRCPYCDAPRKAAEIGKHVGEHCQTFRARFGLPLPGEAAAPVTQGDALPEDEAIKRMTAAMREADATFERVGGGTRHHVRDCLLPVLEKHGLRLVAAPVTTPAQEGLVVCDDSAAGAVPHKRGIVCTNPRPAPADAGKPHWDDCALNHGGTACDMGPDCGTDPAAEQPAKEDTPCHE